MSVKARAAATVITPTNKPVDQQPRKYEKLVWINTQTHSYTFAASLSERRRYCGARRLYVCVSVCLSAEPRLYRRVGGEGL